MCRISEDIWNESKAEDVKALMENTEWSFTQACDMLKIAQSDRLAIKELLQA